MRWVNKGHEFDAVAELYEKDYVISRKIFIFGAGRVGVDFSKTVEHFGVMMGFIDNDEEKQGIIVNGLKVIAIREFLTGRTYDELIVICMNKAYENDVVRQLEELQLKHYKDYMTQSEYEMRFRIMNFYKNDVIYIPLTQISLTERCTLRCRKCAHACNLVPKNKKDLSLDDAKKSADYFFKYVDFVGEFVLIGGEPFLYNELRAIAEYVGCHYRKQIGIFSITTNGTLMPNDDVITACKNFDIMIRVSNYSNALPFLKEKIQAFKKKMDDNGVECIVSKENGTWMDYGFDYVNRKASPHQLEKIFDDCCTPCHEVRGNRFYYCVMARSVAENMDKSVGDDDFFDLAKKSDKLGRIYFFEYSMGYSDKGYLDMCNYCYGADAINYPIPKAEQMEGESSWRGKS